MSNQAKRLIAEKLEDHDEMGFDELVGQLEQDLDVQRKTCETYVYQYTKREERLAGEQVVTGMRQEHVDAAVDAEFGEGDFDSDDPVPPVTGKSFHALGIRQPGHPDVPKVGEFVKRRMGGDDMDMDVEFDEGSTLLEVVTAAMSAPDFGTVLVGEPGTGKSYTIKKVCDEANIPWTRVNFGSRVTKEKLVGGFVPKGNGETLEEDLAKAKDLAQEHEDLNVASALEVIGQRENFKWVDGLLTKRVRNGGVFQADELNAAPPEALMPLHGLLEDAANRSLELLEKGEVVQPHEDFMFVGTMNPPSFRGTNELNSAFKDRVIPIPVPRLAEEAEKGLLRSTTVLGKDEAETLVDLSRDISSAENSPPCTLRELRKIAEMKDTLGLEGAAKMVLTGMATSDTQRDVVQKRIDSVNW